MKAFSKKYSLLCLVFLVIASSFFAMDKGKEKAPKYSPTQSTVIAIDLDDVMSIKQKPGMMNFLWLLQAIYSNPRVFMALMNFSELQRQGAEIGETVNGTANVVHAMFEKLKNEGYGDLSAYEDGIIESATQPKPIQAMVDAVRNLKKQGYIIIGATNQDWKQNEAYRKKMKQQGADLNELFDAVVVTRVNHLMPATEKAQLYDKPVATENMYAGRIQQAFKPNQQYYTVLKKIAERVASEHDIKVKKIIFTDDKKENVDAAQNKGIQALHFNLPGGSARKTSPEDLQETVDTWKAELASLGVNIQ